MSKKKEQIQTDDVVALWTGIEESVEMDYSNLIAPMMYHRGSDMYANIELTGCVTVPNIDSSYVVNVLVDFECMRDDVLRMIAHTRTYAYTGVVDTATIKAGRLSNTYRHLIDAKRAKLAMVNEIDKYINKGGIVDLQKFLSEEWSNLITAFSGLLIENKNWRVGAWDLKYWYAAITSLRRKNIKIPKTVTIKINADNKIRFNLEKFEPVLTTNTGLRIKAKYLYLISQALGIPWGFPGIWEWLELVDRLPIGDWVEEGAEAGERILKWFSILTKSITEAKKKIMIQDEVKTLRVANIIAIKIMQAAALVAMENKVWEKGMKEAGMPWNREFVISQFAYTMVAEPDGELAWRDWVDRTIKYLGYPSESGERTFYGLIDFGHSLSHIRFMGIKDNEIGVGPREKEIKMESVNIAMYRFYDLKEGWYKQYGATIYRDGSIVPTEWKEHGILMITAVDDWLKVFYRTGAFESPVLKISIVKVLGSRKSLFSWRAVMRKLGIKGAYAGLGYKHAIKGRVLPILVEEVSEHEYVDEKDEVLERIFSQRSDKRG